VRNGATSFKLKLVGYFVLLSLLPAAAAFWGFSSVAKQSEARRVDAGLQAGLRAGVAAYVEDLEVAIQQSSRLAHDPVFQQALDRGDIRSAKRLLRYAPHVSVEKTNAFTIGPRPALGVSHSTTLVREDDPWGYVTATIPFDQRTLRKLKARSGLAADERFIVVKGSRVVVGPGWAQSKIDVVPERAATVTIGGKRYRVLVASVEGAKGATLGVISPQMAIDAATARTQRKLLLGLLAALLLVALVAYVEGRSIVRTVSDIGRTANAIARGQLDERVPVKGRDELARLGNAFNQMADQLQARLHELESERHRLREAVSRFGDALAATHDTDQLMRAIVETAVEATGASGGMLIAANGQIVEVGAPGTGSDVLEHPLRAGETAFGTLFLYGRNFDEEARLTAASLVGQSVIALDNAKLHRIVERQASVDGLTGLANRRQTEEVLAAEVARAARFEGPLSIVVGDLDDFKAVNDVHGHPVGDTVLREFARVLTNTVREVDTAGRWGGEEFLIVLPGTDGAGAVRLAQRVRDYLEGRTLLTPEGVPVRISASFGVAEYGAGLTLDELVAAADVALYEAKRSGKNRVQQAPTVLNRP